jgi:CubicO group peptidase (beta-lactamase class C family)
MPKDFHRAAAARYEPGRGWVYSVSVDIQGSWSRSCRANRRRFPAERIFEPLGMNDTAFFVPQNKLSRLRRSTS